MPTKTKIEPETFPPPAGCATHERGDWLPDIPLPWVQEIRAKHVALAAAWARAVDTIGAARDEHADLEVDYRRAVRDAVAVGGEPPPRPEALDPALRDARISLAVEDAEAARDDLAEHVLLVLAELRAHRAELHPHLAAFGPELLDALSRGSANQVAIVRERVRRQLAELEADGPAIEVLDDPLEAAA